MIGTVILEGLGLGALLVLVCAFGIRNGAVGMVHLYEPEVQERCVALGLTTHEKIRRSKAAFKALCIPGYVAYVLVFVYAVNGARGFREGFWQLLVILFVMNLIDRFLVDGYWVGHTQAWTIPGTEDLKPYINAAAKRKKWLFGTVGLAVIAAISAVVVFFAGIAAAYYIAKLPRLVKGVLDVILTLHLVLPPTVVGYLLLRSVVYPAAAGDSLLCAVVYPGHGAGDVPPAYVRAQAAAGLVEHGDAVQGAESLPQHQHRGVEGAEDQRQQRVPGQHGQLVLEGEGRLRRPTIALRQADGLGSLLQAEEVLVRGVLDDAGYRQLVQRVAHLQNGTYFLVPQVPAVVGHDGLQGVQRSRPAIVRHKGTHTGAYLQKAAVLQFHDAAVDHRTADAQGLRQLALRRQLLSHRQLAGQDHGLDMADEQLLQ